MVKRWILTLCLFYSLAFLSCSVVHYADFENEPVRATGDFVFFADFAIFQKSQDTLNVVLYLKFPNSVLTFTKGESGFLASYDGTVAVKKFEGKRIITREFEGHVEELSYEAAHSPNHFCYREFSFELAPGKFSVNVSLQDRNSQRQGSVQRVLNVEAYPRNRISLSSIVFAERFEGDASEEMSIVPNPDRIYGERLPELSFYCQVYIPEEFQQRDSLRTQYEIMAQHSGNCLHHSDGPTMTSARGKTTLSDMIYLRGIQEEDVALKISIRDSDGNVLATRKGNFHIHWSLVNWGDDFKLSLAQLELVASGEVVAEYKKIQPEEREPFLKDYWRSRDPVPQTEQNELLIEFERRLRHVKRHLGGIWTDKGRIYVQNGPPQDREKRIVRDMFGYARYAEIWIYYDPYREFVFIDDRLVHR